MHFGSTEVQPSAQRMIAVGFILPLVCRELKSSPKKRPCTPRFEMFYWPILADCGAQ
jgi:hypothetical protein